MILFESDWEHYPSAIRDYKTSNHSFLELAALLKKMGVRNNDFFLCLLQPELQGVDPYSPDLTQEQKEMIALEVEFNVWYYLREIMRVPPQSGIDPVPFRANRANISMIWSFLNHIDYMLIQPRQTGKSVSTDALMSWLYLFVLRNAKIMLITKDETLRVENIMRLRNIRSFFPKWLVVDDKTDANNTYMLTYNQRGNRYLTGVGQNSEDGANKLGRGVTVAILHIDESPFIPFVDVTIPAAIASGNAATDEAAKNGLPYGNIFTTTAGKIDTRSGKFMYDIYSNGATWDDRVFYDAPNADVLHELVMKKKKGDKLIIIGEFNHRQLGYTDAWLYEKIAKSAATEDAADRDFFNRWTMGSLSSPLSTQLNMIIQQSEMDPLHVWISPNNYVLNWYIDELEIRRRINSGTKFLLGLDTSDAINRDAIALTIIDQTDLSTVARATVNDTNLLKVARFCCDLVVKYENLLWIIEKKSSAQTFIDTALLLLPAAGIDPFKRMFNRIVDDRFKHEAMYDEIQKTPMARRDQRFYERYRSYFGFNTSGVSRELLYSQVLQNGAKRAGALIRDRELSNQIRKLVIKNGRVDHSASGNDDAVISWLLAQWWLMYGRNLDYYGIDTRKICLRVGNDGEVATPEELELRAQREALKEEIELLLEELVSNQTLQMQMLCEARIRTLSKRMERIPGGDPMSIDEMIGEAKEARSRKIRDLKRRAA